MILSVITIGIAIAVVINFVREHYKVQRATERAREQTNTLLSLYRKLHSASMALTSTKSMAEFAQVVVGYGMEVLKANAAVISIYNPTTDVWETKESDGFDRSFINLWHTFLKGSSYPMQDLTGVSRPMIFAPQAENNEPHLPGLAAIRTRIGDQTLVVWPLRSERRTLCVLGFSLSSTRGFETDSLLVMRDFAIRCLETLKRLELEEEERFDEADLETGIRPAFWKSTREDFRDSATAMSITQ